MRIVRNLAELPAAVEAAQREARSAFGDEAVFLEPYVDAPRHIEVQIFGDTHGNIIHLLERECSIQRPPSEDRRRGPVRGARRRAARRDLQRRGACGPGHRVFERRHGRVPARPRSAVLFLEVNTRLQVEHPVTEEILGLDLVRLQILVAQGKALPAEIWQAKAKGHAIEVRLYAEDPAQGYAPSTVACIDSVFPRGAHSARIGRD